MIPLRIRAEAPAAPHPFVVRLGNDGGSNSGLSGVPLTENAAAQLLAEDETSLEYQTGYGTLRLHDTSLAAVTGDVLLVIPARKIALRLIRSQSQHNTLLVTEQCDQLCVMCSQPPKPNHVNLFPYFERAAMLAPQDATIGISGGEPTLNKRALFYFLERVLERRPDLQFHVLTNAQHFEPTDVEALDRIPRARVIWGVPLYAASASLHDDIVGKAGAYDRLLSSLALMCRAGLVIELRTVLMRPNAEALPELAQFASTHLPFLSVWAIMQLENIGFARKNWDSLFFDNAADFSPVAAAIDIASGRGLSVALYNFPLCTVPATYRNKAAASISDWKRRYLELCDDCELKAGCGGFFEWYPKERGFSRLGLS